MKSKGLSLRIITGGPTALEREINQFLKENPYLEIEHISQTQSPISTDNGRAVTYIAVSIWYYREYNEDEEEMVEEEKMVEIVCNGKVLYRMPQDCTEVKEMQRVIDSQIEQHGYSLYKIRGIKGR
jgi:hypothetical protein